LLRINAAIPKPENSEIGCIPMNPISGFCETIYDSALRQREKSAVAGPGHCLSGLKPLCLQLFDQARFFEFLQSLVDGLDEGGIGRPNRHPVLLV